MSSSGSSYSVVPDWWSDVVATLISQCPSPGVAGSSVIIGGPASAQATTGASTSAPTHQRERFMKSEPAARGRRRICLSDTCHLNGKYAADRHRCAKGDYAGPA